MVSQILGGAKKYVGPISFKSWSTVAALSGQLMANPVTMDWAYEKMWSPTHAIGRYDRISSSLWRPSNAAAFRAGPLRFRWGGIAPLGAPGGPGGEQVIGAAAARPRPRRSC